jgi:hypothetical protein
MTMFTKPSMFRFAVYVSLAALTTTLAWVLVGVGHQLGLTL